MLCRVIAMGVLYSSCIVGAIHGTSTTLPIWARSAGTNSYRLRHQLQRAGRRRAPTTGDAALPRLPLQRVDDDRSGHARGNATVWPMASTTAGRSSACLAPTGNVPRHAFLYSGSDDDRSGHTRGNVRSVCQRHQRQRAGRRLVLHHRQRRLSRLPLQRVDDDRSGHARGNEQLCLRHQRQRAGRRLCLHHRQRCLTPSFTAGRR